jgi:hypothetical protein
MQQRPDKAALMEALAQFLMSEVYPAIPDKKLNFRVLIAANLATIVASELKTEDERAASELSRLQALLPGVSDGDPSKMTDKARAEALSALNRALATGLRERRFSPELMPRVQAHLRQTLSETLGVVNPRFDLSPIIE